MVQRNTNTESFMRKTLTIATILIGLASTAMQASDLSKYDFGPKLPESASTVIVGGHKFNALWMNIFDSNNKTIGYGSPIVSIPNQDWLCMDCIPNKTFSYDEITSGKVIGNNLDEYTLIQADKHDNKVLWVMGLAAKGKTLSVLDANGKPDKGVTTTITAYEVDCNKFMFRIIQYSASQGYLKMSPTTTHITTPGQWGRPVPGSYGEEFVKYRCSIK
jgi:hypothetical protein